MFESLGQFFELNFYKSHRKQQLDHEAEIHRQLAHTTVQDCPSVVAELLLYRARVNRQQFEASSRADFLSLVSVVDTHMKWIDNHHKTLSDALTADDVCGRVETIIREY